MANKLVVHLAFEAPDSDDAIVRGGSNVTLEFRSFWKLCDCSHHVLSREESLDFASAVEDADGLICAAWRTSAALKQIVKGRTSDYCIFIVGNDSPDASAMTLQ